jgi:two-component system repressor protein LuxO
VAEGRFREDVYYRLAVVPIHMPPLRDRGTDIAELGEYFLQRFAREEEKTFDPLGPNQIAAMNAHTWPGNVRELQNILRRAAVMQPGPSLPISAFPLAALQAVAPAQSSAPQVPQQAVDTVPASTKLFLAQALDGMTLDDIERLVIENAIEAAGGSVPTAARKLGVSVSTLYRKRERWAEAV